MLSKDDLKSIKGVLEETIDSRVPEIIQREVPGIVEEIVDPKLENLAMMIARSFQDVYDKIVTKDYLDRELKRFAIKEDLIDMEQRLGYQWLSQFDALRDDMSLVKAKLNLS